MHRTLFTYASPWGDIHGAYTQRGICSLLAEAPAPAAPVAETPPALSAALTRYFAGEEEGFADFPLDMDGATDFTVSVWKAAMQVPWGHTSTYGELAKKVGGATHARAVGRALGANPLLILVPCHRFIAQDGGLVNFAAGLEWKRRLLQLEGSLMV